MRLFVGLSLPGDVRTQLGRLERGIPLARWVPFESMHITLAFIGEVSGAKAQEIAVELGGIRGRRFPVSIRGVGHFGPSHQPRSLWAGVELSEPLKQLRASVLRRLEQIEVVLQRRRFRPHVTLARLRGEAGHHFANFVSEHSPLRISDFTVTTVDLFSSHLSAEGAVHDVINCYPLSAVD